MKKISKKISYNKNKVQDILKQQNIKNISLFFSPIKKASPDNDYQIKNDGTSKEPPHRFNHNIMRKIKKLASPKEI